MGDNQPSLPQNGDNSSNDDPTTISYPPLFPDTNDDLTSNATTDDTTTTTLFQTFVHLLKGNIGAGCLSLPWAFSRLGIPLGTAFTVVMASITSYNSLQLIEVKNHIVDRKAEERREQREEEEEEEDRYAPIAAVKQEILSYSDIGEAIYGKSFGVFVGLSVCTLQLAICTVYFSFIGVNIMSVIEHSASENFGLLDNYVVVVSLILPAILGLSLIPNLKMLAPVIKGATLLLFLAFGLLGVMIGLNWENRPGEVPSVQWPSVPMAICPIMFSFEGICLVLPVESAMSQPSKFPTIYKYAMVTVCSIFVVFASLCVFAFGAVDNGSITAFLMDNFDSIMGDELVLAANVLVTFSVLFSYPLQLFPSIQLMVQMKRMVCGGKKKERSPNSSPTCMVKDGESTVKFFSLNNHEDPSPPVVDAAIGNANESTVQNVPAVGNDENSPLLRIILVLSTWTVAVIIPNVEELISLAGALAGALNALIIPPLLQLKLYKDIDESSSWKVTRCYILIGVGVIAGIIGTVASVKDIIEEFR